MVCELLVAVIIGERLILTTLFRNPKSALGESGEPARKEKTKKKDQMLFRLDSSNELVPAPPLPYSLQFLAADPRLDLTEMVQWKDFVTQIPHVKGRGGI